MTTDPFDALFGRLRYNRFDAMTDPNWVPQERPIGGDVIESSGFIEDGAVEDTSFATGINAVLLVATLPAAASYPNRLAFLTTDQKLYRSDGATWTAAVPTTDLTGQITSTQITDDAVTAAKIFAGAVTADKIDTGAVTAAKLETTLVLAGTIIAGVATAEHVKLNSTGMTLYDSALAPRAVFPNDSAEDVYVKGTIEADTLTTTVSASLRGNTSVEAGAAVTLQSTTPTPDAAPTVSQGWDTITLDASVRKGLCYSATGGTGGATKVFYAADSASWQTVREFLASGVTNRTLDTSAYLGNVLGVCQHGTNLYVVGQNVTDAISIRVVAFAVADFSWQATYDAVDYAYGYPAPQAIASDGTYLYIAALNASNYPTWNAYNSSMVKQGSTVTGDTVASGTQMRGIYVGSADFGGARVVVTAEGYPGAQVYNATGAYQADESFPGSGANMTGVTYGDAQGDGACFWTQPVYNGTTITKHTGWTWTSATSALYWVGYSWYDNLSTLHETALGPRVSITMGKRKRLQVITPTIPGGGGAEEPSLVRVYMAPSATEPAAGSYWLQLQEATTSHYITSYTSSGTNDGAGTAFPPGTAAAIASAGGSWALSGDGTGDLGLLVTGGKPPTVTVLSSGSGTYTPPTGIAFAIAELIGGGGAGGGCAATGSGQAASSGGGGGGGFCRKVLTAAELAAGAVSYAVGAGGTGVSGNNSGNAGAASTLSGAGFTTLSAGGGAGGSGSSATSGNLANSGGTGGTSSGADDNITGSDGFRGLGLSGTRLATGVGGAAARGGGASGTTLGATGQAGNSPGGGGSGAALSASTAAVAGGAGSAGQIVITEYYVG